MRTTENAWASSCVGNDDPTGGPAHRATEALVRATMVAAEAVGLAVVAAAAVEWANCGAFVACMIAESANQRRRLSECENGVCLVV